MSMFSAFDVTASGLTAQRLRYGRYLRKCCQCQYHKNRGWYAVSPQNRYVPAEESAADLQPVLHNVSSGYSGSGVKVSQIFEDTTTEMNMVYDPSHPDADENGYVTYPNVNIVTEMTDLIDASRSYEANSTAFNASKSMALKGLEIGQ